MSDSANPGIESPPTFDPVGPLVASTNAVPRSTTETVTWMRHWTPTLLSLRSTRSPQLRFAPGHYVRLGLAPPVGEVIWRPYSMVSSDIDNHLEFVAKLVPGGAFSTELARIKVGDHVRVSLPTYGFLTLDQLAPGNDLWLIATGTGIGPFVSILRTAKAWRDFGRIFLVHSVRSEVELAYRDEIEQLQAGGPFAGASARLSFLPVVTREPDSTFFAPRVSRQIDNGTLERSAGGALDPAHARVMVCGNPELNVELRRSLGARGFRPTRRGVLGQMAFENYW